MSDSEIVCGAAFCLTCRGRPTVYTAVSDDGTTRWSMHPMLFAPLYWGRINEPRKGWPFRVLYCCHASTPSKSCRGTIEEHEYGGEKFLNKIFFDDEQRWQAAMFWLLEGGLDYE